MLTRPSLVQLCLSPIDFRKNIDTLALLVSAEMSGDPLSGTMFVFFNRGLDKVKILQYDRHGFWLCYKRLERGRFVLPPLSCLSFLDLQLLLEGSKRPPQTISIVASEPFKLQFLEQARCHRNQIGSNNAHNGMNE